MLTSSFGLRCILCVLSSTVLMALMFSVVYGQAPAAPAPASKKKIVYKEKSYYDFEDTLINGNLRKPDGSFIFRKSQSTFSSGLNLHRSFIPELKQSAAGVR